MVRFRSPTTWLALAVYAGALTHYLVNATPDVTSMDSGELIAGTHVFGTLHGMGYHLYVLAGKLIELIPLGNISFRIVVLNAVTGAAVMAILSRTAAWGLPGTGEAIGSTPWSYVALGGGILWLSTRQIPLAEATHAENSMLFHLLVILACAQLFPGIRERANSPSGPRLLRSIALLALATSYFPAAFPGVVLLLCCLLFMVRRKATWGLALLSASGIVLLPLIATAIRAAQAPAIGGPRLTVLFPFAGVWKQYLSSPFPLNSDSRASDLVRAFLSADLNTLEYLRRSFPDPLLWIVLLLALLGAVRALRRAWLPVAFLALVACGSAVQRMYSPGSEADTQSLPLHLIVALAACWGLNSLPVLAASLAGSKHANHPAGPAPPSGARWPTRLVRLLAKLHKPSAAAVAMAAVWALTHTTHSARLDLAGRRFAQEALSRAPEAALLVVRDVPEHFLFLPLLVVENQRPDMLVVNQTLLPLGPVPPELGRLQGQAQVSPAAQPKSFLEHFWNDRPVLLTRIGWHTPAPGSRGYYSAKDPHLKQLDLIPLGTAFQVARSTASQDHDRPPRPDTSGVVDGHALKLWQWFYLDLALLHSDKGDQQSYVEALRDALAANPSDRRVQLLLQRALRDLKSPG
ncbi:MAG: DUF2723 domain-containing protein [Nitrospirae bacterium]|nr:DUF2723 domain-containing protein [Nitrospirota bacterium]